MFRVDRDEPLSSMLPTLGSFSPKPFVIRFQPHITLQSAKTKASWADETMIEQMNQQQLPSVEPLSPIIDLSTDHIYNDTAIVARPQAPLSLHTVLWSREQDQKYPWTK
ncbi:unnamed protein product [Strongylus vulgaris]|uniref:Uncharacterized protein n=1 Tax=Strongylus vulgaris TaxID=40348 RepID=A0A3P7IWY7_STRVU|nr:unnamed protein product [Strongylus vulgaris]